MSEDHRIYERLARLEEQNSQQSRALVQISAKQDEMLADLSRYRGWTGGVLAVVGLVTAAIKLFGGSITAMFQ